ncbi:MAG: hypothetical protein RLZZ378_749, partial [Actinomycetota bacterium]
QRNFRYQEEIIDIDYDVLDLESESRYPSMRLRAIERLAA